MGSYFTCGKLRMKAENPNKNHIMNNMDDVDESYGFDDLDGYPFTEPKIYLEGMREDYFPQIPFSWSNDSIISVRDKWIVEYTQANFAELLAKDEDGNIVWMDGRSAPYDDCWNGEYLDEIRGAYEFRVTLYNVETSEKKQYKMVLDKTSELSVGDYRRLSEFVDADVLGSHMEINDGVLCDYFGNDEHLVIPDSVTVISENVFGWGKRQFESISIPKSVIDIPYTMPEFCKVNRIDVDADNPKYYSKNGCLIDKETKTLVWCYSGCDIPDDASIKVIGNQAFAFRKDIENIVVPDGIEEIGAAAFRCCDNLESIAIPESVTKIGASAFTSCKKLTQVQLPPLLTTIDMYTFDCCINLVSVCLPNSLRTIERGAFFGCDVLKNIDLPKECLKEIQTSYDRKLIKENNRWSYIELEKSTLANFNF